jgi:hypothetical protein
MFYITQYAGDTKPTPIRGSRSISRIGIRRCITLKDRVLTPGGKAINPLNRKTMELGSKSRLDGTKEADRN